MKNVFDVYVRLVLMFFVVLLGDYLSKITIYILNIIPNIYHEVILIENVDFVVDNYYHRIVDYMDSVNDFYNIQKKNITYIFKKKT